MFMGFFYGAAENSKMYRHVLEAQLCVVSLPFVRLVSWCFDRCHDGCHIRVESRVVRVTKGATYRRDLSLVQ